MTTATPIHIHDRDDEPTYARQDSHQDRRIDVQTGVFTATVAEAQPVEGAFVIVLANHKGGVTKTTSTANLGVLLAEAGRRVLIVDCDPQANLSELFGWTKDLPGERLEDLLARPDAAGRYAPPVALQPDIGTELGWRELLRIIPSTDALADVAAELPRLAGDGYAQRLAELLMPLRERFDVILLDTPPGRGNLSGMAVLAADGLLIPALAADLDVRGAGKLYDLVEDEIPGLRILGVLIAASERRWRITRDATERMLADEMRVLPVSVPRAVRVASAPRFRAPTAVLEPDSMVTHAYRQLGAAAARRGSAMSRGNAQMPSARRGPIPGMTSAPTSAPPQPAERAPQRAGETGAPAEEAPATRHEEPSGGSAARREPSAVNAPEVPQLGHRGRPAAPSSTRAAPVGRRRPSRDYASTRLVNFRIPVDLHDRYKRLVREVEQTHLRLRHPSLTEVLIGLLEEGPDTPEEIAAVIRRKCASEHGTEDHA